MSRRSRRRQQLLAFRGRHWVWRWYRAGNRPLMTFSATMWDADGNAHTFRDWWPR